MTDEFNLVKAIKSLDGAEFFGGLMTGVTITALFYTMILSFFHATATSNLGGCITTEHKGVTYVQVSPKCTKLFNSFVYPQTPLLIEADEDEFAFFGAGAMHIGKVKNSEVFKSKEPCELCVELKEVNE